MKALRVLRKGLRVLFAGDVQWYKALRLRVAPGIEHLDVLRLMQPRAVVDIGANRGQFALVARHCFAQAVILSFEPLATPARSFRRIFTEDHSVKLFESAIGAVAGSATIHISARDDSSSLLPISAEQNRLFPGTAEVGVQEIRVGRLGDFVTAADIASPALLKLDVQGFELQALRGCEDLLDRFEWIYVECSFIELYERQVLADGVIAWLRERGFALRGIYNATYDGQGRAVQADFWFSRHIPNSVDTQAS